MICKQQIVQIVREFQFYTRWILKKSVSRPAGYHTGFRLQPSALETGEREGVCQVAYRKEMECDNSVHASLSELFSYH